MAVGATGTARWIGILVVFVSAVNCGGSSGGDEQWDSTTTTGERAVISLPGVSTTFVAQTTAIPARFEFVDYSVAGGVARVSDHLKVFPDGRVVYGDGQRELASTIPPATVAELRTALEAADLASLPPVSGSPTPDAVTHRVIFGGQAVRFYDTAMPPPLGPAIAILTRELNRAKQRR